MIGQIVNIGQYKNYRKTCLCGHDFIFAPSAFSCAVNGVKFLTDKIIVNQNKFYIIQKVVIYDLDEIDLTVFIDDDGLLCIKHNSSKYNTDHILSEILDKNVSNNANYALSIARVCTAHCEFKYRMQTSTFTFDFKNMRVSNFYADEEHFEFPHKNYKISFKNNLCYVVANNTSYCFPEEVFSKLGLDPILLQQKIDKYILFI